MNRYLIKPRAGRLLGGVLLVAMASTSTLAIAQSMNGDQMPSSGFSLTPEESRDLERAPVSIDPPMQAGPSGMPPELQREILESDLDMILEMNEASDEVRREVLISRLRELDPDFDLDSLGAGDPQPAPSAVSSVNSASTARSGDVVSQPSSVSPTVGIELADDEDPIARRAEELLREGGLIQRQADIGASILLLERQAAQAQAIEEIIRLKGPDAEIEVSPGVFETFETMPAARKLQLELAALEKQVEESAAPDPEPAGIIRNDGTSFQQMPQVNGRVLVTNPPAPAPTPTPQASISLREVFGSNGNYEATVRVGNERVRIMEGDDLPGGVEIIEIGPDFIIIDRNGRESRLSLRG